MLIDELKVTIPVIPVLLSKAWDPIAISSYSSSLIVNFSTKFGFSQKASKELVILKYFLLFTTNASYSIKPDADSFVSTRSNNNLPVNSNFLSVEFILVFIRGEE